MREEPLSLDDDDDYRPRYRRRRGTPVWVWVSVGSAVLASLVAGIFVLRSMRREQTREPERTSVGDSRSKPGERTIGKEVTGVEIETFGKELLGKPCTMMCRLQGVSDTWVQLLLRDDSYVGFFVIDSKGDLVQRVFASKEKYGRKLIAMKKGDYLQLIGRVETVRSSVGTGYYAFMVDEIR